MLWICPMQIIKCPPRHKRKLKNEFVPSSCKNHCSCCNHFSCRNPSWRCRSLFDACSIGFFPNPTSSKTRHFKSIYAATTNKKWKFSSCTEKCYENECSCFIGNQEQVKQEAEPVQKLSSITGVEFYPTSKSKKLLNCCSSHGQRLMAFL